MQGTVSDAVAGALAAAVLLLTVGCEGPEGPPGPPGPQTFGVDESCTLCHTDDTELFARQVQYQASTHYLGGNFERSTTRCAGCHTHEGFVERLASGEQEPAQDIVDPSPVNCRTCHQIHTTYTRADYRLTTEAPFALWASGELVDLGQGNLCGQCHQARPLDPAPVIDGEPVAVTSRYGFHHGPQAQVVGGTGGFEFTGSVSIRGGASSHGSAVTNPGGCTTCHMAEPYGSQAGGHSWSMTYLYHGHEEDLTAGCAGCHTLIEDFDLNGFQTAMQAKLDSLGALLRAIGIVAQDSDSRVAGTWPANVAAAAVNWQMILEDRSLGIHNPFYVNGLLQNSIEKMEPLVP